ncbi:hypothetical protein X769_32590 [Mesorhizobium sp. LSJC268A00]|nr:hypothetical protein X769_32590 [Mesorhizobium sp. LSJC268A00]
MLRQAAADPLRVPHDRDAEIAQMLRWTDPERIRIEGE